MGKTLFQIGEDMQALDALLGEVGGDVTDEQAGAAIDRWLEENRAALAEKLDGYCWVLKEREARCLAREAESKRLAELARSDRNAARRLKDRLKEFFARQGMERFETAHFKLAVQPNGGKRTLLVNRDWTDDPTAAPEQYHRRVILLDTEAIRADVEAGVEVEGCELAEHGTHLRVR
jgi:parvulin-like peptidyl-prolyl isomerase